jgi:hypothetical protein
MKARFVNGWISTRSSNDISVLLPPVFAEWPIVVQAGGRLVEDQIVLNQGR